MMQIKAKFTKKNAGLYLFCVASFHLCLQDESSNQHVIDMRIIESVFNSHRLRITFVAAAFCFPLYMLETRSEPHINVTKSDCPQCGCGCHPVSKVCVVPCEADDTKVRVERSGIVSTINISALTGTKNDTNGTSFGTRLCPDGPDSIPDLNDDKIQFCIGGAGPKRPTYDDLDDGPLQCDNLQAKFAELREKVKQKQRINWWPVFYIMAIGNFLAILFQIRAMVIVDRQRRYEEEWDRVRLPQLIHAKLLEEEMLNRMGRDNDTASSAKSMESNVDPSPRDSKKPKKADPSPDAAKAKRVSFHRNKKD